MLCGFKIEIHFKCALVYCIYVAKIQRACPKAHTCGLCTWPLVYLSISSTWPKCSSGHEDHKCMQNV